MKKILVTLVLASILASCSRENSPLPQTTTKSSKITEELPPIGAKVTWTMGRPKFDCKKGIWFCKIKDVKYPPDMPGDKSTSIFPSDDVSSSIYFNFSTKKAVVIMSGLVSDTSSYFYGDSSETLTFPDSVAAKWGYSKISILPGTYPYTVGSGTTTVTTDIDVQ